MASVRSTAERAEAGEIALRSWQRPFEGSRRESSYLLEAPRKIEFVRKPKFRGDLLIGQSCGAHQMACALDETCRPVARRRDAYQLHESALKCGVGKAQPPG
jgi:hypothetical protein